MSTENVPVPNQSPSDVDAGVVKPRPESENAASENAASETVVSPPMPVHETAPIPTAQDEPAAASPAGSQSAGDQSVASNPEGSENPPTEPNPVTASPAMPVPAEALAERPADHAGTPAASATDSEEPRRKLQLRPSAPEGESARAIPSLGGSDNAPTAPQAPVEVPSRDDAEVEAEIQRAVGGGTAEESTQQTPQSPAEAVEVPPQESIDASLEAAIDAAMSETPAANQKNEPAVDIDHLRPGDKLQGTVQTINDEGAFLDFGLRLSGLVAARQFTPKNKPSVGETIAVVFDRVDETEGLILVNLPHGTTQIQGSDWDALSQGQVLECTVQKTNKGGLEANVGSLRAFIPASQVELGYVADLESYVGQKLRVRVTEVNRSKRRLILSRRSLLAEEQAAAKEELLKELKPDQVRTGRVKTIKEYGAFVDLGGMDGFLPIAQISWVRIEHPSEVLAEGQEIEVKVLSVDREKNRVSLGMRQLSPNPWRSVDTKYGKGTNITGRVTRVEAFGAFVELEPGVEGLVHISELDHRRVKRVTEVLNVGDMAEVQVLETDPGKKRISLSVKALKAKPEAPKDEDQAPGKGETYQRRRKESLKGGTGTANRGGLFGNPKDFG